MHNAKPSKITASFNSQYGPPGPLAKKLVELIRRRLSEADNQFSPILRLGTFREICIELGDEPSGHMYEHIEDALKQLTHTVIVALADFKDTKGALKKIQDTGSILTAVFFPKNILPDGSEADAVFVRPNDFYFRLSSE